MSIEIKAPTFPESVADGTVATWHKKPGEAVKRDELIVDIETDKVVLEVVAPADGSIAEIIKGEGETVLSNEVIARFVEGAAAGVPVAAICGATPAGMRPAAEERYSSTRERATKMDDPSPRISNGISAASRRWLISPASRMSTPANSRLINPACVIPPYEPVSPCGL